MLCTTRTRRMVNVNRTCRTESCGKQPFGVSGTKTAKYCTQYAPDALPLAIDLRAFFVSLTTGESPSDRAVGFCDRPSIIVRLRAAEVVLGKEVKYRLHLARISSSFRRSFPFSSLIYCALPNFLPCNFYPPLKCPYQPLKSPATMNSSSSQVYTSKYPSSAAWMVSLSFCMPSATREKRSRRPRCRVPPSEPLRSPSRLLQIHHALPRFPIAQIYGTVGFGLALPPLRTVGVCR